MEYFPPVHQVFILCVDQFVVDGGEQPRPFFVHGDVKSLEARFFGDLLTHILQDEDKVFLGQTQVVAGLKGGGESFL